MWIGRLVAQTVMAGLLMAIGWAVTLAFAERLNGGLGAGLAIGLLALAHTAWRFHNAPPRAEMDKVLDEALDAVERASTDWVDSSTEGDAGPVPEEIRERVVAVLDAIEAGPEEPLGPEAVDRHVARLLEAGEAEAVAEVLMCEDRDHIAAMQVVAAWHLAADVPLELSGQDMTWRAVRPAILIGDDAVAVATADRAARAVRDCAVLRAEFPAPDEIGKLAEGREPPASAALVAALGRLADALREAARHDT